MIFFRFYTTVFRTFWGPKRLYCNYESLMWSNMFRKSPDLKLPRRALAKFKNIKTSFLNTRLIVGNWSRHDQGEHRTFFKWQRYDSVKELFRNLKMIIVNRKNYYCKIVSFRIALIILFIFSQHDFHRFSQNNVLSRKLRYGIRGNIYIFLKLLLTANNVWLYSKAVP